MINPYVRSSEKVLFAFALVFSLLFYALLAAGAGLLIVNMRSANALSAASAAEFEKMTGEEPIEDGDLVQAQTIGMESSEDDFSEDEFAEDEFSDGESSDGYADEYAEEDFEYASDPVSSIASTAMGAAAAVFLVYFLIIVAIVIGAHIITVGHLMGNGVRVNDRQFPELWAEFERAAMELGVRKLPAFYLVESGGILNAFATRLFTRNYVAIYADLAERLYAGDPGPVSYVIAHELVHVRRNHSIKGLITLPAEMVPFLKGAWRRACEYTCDAGGQELASAGAEKGLILLAAGPRLAPRVDADVYLETFKAERSVWKRFAELFASHPHLPKRIAALRKRAEMYR